MEQTRSFTQSMSWLHTWAGLLLGWLLFAIFLTGTLAVFDKELNWWMQPELSDHGLDQAGALRTAQQWLSREQAEADAWNIRLPTLRDPSLSVSAGERRRGGGQLLDPLSGEPLQARDTAGGNFFFHFHYTLHLPRTLGIWVVGLAAMAMLVALVSGIVIHKKIFKDFFTFRPGKGQRSWLDGHNASAVLLLPFHLMITYTGLVIFYGIYMPAAMDALYDGDRMAMMREARPGLEAERAAGQDGGMARRGERSIASAPPADLLPLQHFLEQGEALIGQGMVASIRVSHPGRANAEVEVGPLLGSRIALTKGESLAFNGVTGELIRGPAQPRALALTQRVMAGLHFAQFGGYPMRWLYLLCGLVSCAMIASGLVVYTVKQRKRIRADQPGALAFLRLVESVNVAVVAGLALACVALLWGNRLLPVALDGRQGWEIGLFFAVWLLSLAHARWRRPLQAWREQLGLTALLCLSLPLLDWLTLPAGALDSTRLLLSTTGMVIGALLAVTAWRVTPDAPVSVRCRMQPAGAQP